MTTSNAAQPAALRGVFVIVTTPFDDELNLDEAALERTLTFCFDAAVHGVVATANASEVGYLADDERRLVAERVVAAARGKATAVVGVSASCAPLACRFARHAEDIGADAIMAMPPTFQKPSEREIRSFYHALAAVTDLPIVLQNYGGPGGTVMSPRFVAELVRELPTVALVKEETEFSSVMMSETMALLTERPVGFMGGKGGKALLDEFRRGACGTMPACEVADVHVALWQALEANDTERAARIFRRVLPLISFEIGYGPAIYKEVLRRRGVIDRAHFRQTGGRVLDELAKVELAQILDDLRAFMQSSYLPEQ